MRYGIFVFLCLVLLLGLMSVQAKEPVEVAQVVVSPTTVRIVVPTSTALPTAGLAPTTAPPTFTPTEPGPAELEAKPEAASINVRAEADINADVLGTIQPGERYVVTGRFFRWIQFRFDPSPTGFAFVYDELIDIFPPDAVIPDLSESLLPTQDEAIVNQTATAEIFQQTPGFEQTLTADVREIEAPSFDVTLNAESTDELIVLPTYTYPPNIVAQAPTQATLNEITVTPQMAGFELSVSEGIAPIVPIVILASLGLIGLLISAVLR